MHGEEVREAGFLCFCSEVAGGAGMRCAGKTLVLHMLARDVRCWHRSGMCCYALCIADKVLVCDERYELTSATSGAGMLT
eukprot:2225043-Rhodomonas_salina.1